MTHYPTGCGLDSQAPPCAKVTILLVTLMKIRITFPTGFLLAIAPDRF
jgi:hypothetical protein